MLHGIDVSSHQGGLLDKNSKWATKYFDFAIIKSTEGVSYHYENQDALVKQCRKNGTLYGLYHYARAEKNTAVDEAKKFLKHSEMYKDAMYALDIEGLSLLNPKIDEWARTWLDTVYNITGKKPLLYISRSLTERFPLVCKGDYGLWVAEWNASVVGDIKPWNFWALWQYDKLDCLNIDMNFFNGNEEMFKRYCGV